MTAAALTNEMFARAVHNNISNEKYNYEVVFLVSVALKIALTVLTCV